MVAARHMLFGLALGWASLLGTIAPGPSQAAAPPDSISGPEISMLLRSTVVALDQANLTGNYSVLRDLGDAVFQSRYSQSALADMFRAFRDNEVSLGAVVLVDAELDEPPRLTTDGYLRLVGHFPTSPQRVVFDITYHNEGGPWRIDGVNVGLHASTAENQAPQEQGVTAPMPAPLPRWREAIASNSDQTGGN